MNSHVDFLNIIQWNANSLLSRIHELYQFMNENHTHIACISETLFKETDNIPSHPNFHIHRLDRQDLTNNHRSGGVAIIIRRNITHRLLPHLGTKLLETIGVEVSFTNNSKIKIFSVYLPGGATREQISQHYKQDLRKLTNHQCSFIAAGDFNSRHRLWNCIRANQAGKILFDDHQHNQYLIFHPDEPTYFPPQANTTPSYIDLVLTNGIHQVSHLDTHESSSDHQLITMKIGLQCRQQLNEIRLIPHFKAADWSTYKSVIDFELTSFDIPTIAQVTTTAQIDQLVSKLNDTIMVAQQSSVPLITPTRYALNLTPEIKQKIKMRNDIKRQSQRPQNYNIRHLLKHHLNFLNKEIQDDINEISNTNYNHMLSTIPHDGQNKRLWQTSKFLKNRDRFMPPLKVPNGLAMSSEEKANTLADQFVENHTNPLATDNISFTRHVKNTTNRFISRSVNDSDVEFVDTDETMVMIRKLKNSKAPGLDKVHNCLIKNLPPVAVLLLTLIINSCLKLSYFPDTWKHAKVIAIKKPGKPASKPLSYRPISLLSSLSKLLERAILSRVNDHLIAHDIIPEQQHGFRSQYSTVTQLHKLTTHMRESLREKLSTGLISIDIEKAFDRVWHDGLVYQLIKIKLPQYLTRIIHSFLSRRSFQTVVNGKLSSIRDIQFGVPQGSVLGPTLYILQHIHSRHSNCSSLSNFNVCR